MRYRRYGGVFVALAMTGFMMTAGAGAQRAAAALGQPPASALPAGPLTAATAVRASELASLTGQPVEVLGDRTDWSQTLAMPDGGFEATESLVPQRVQEPDGSWVPVDTTLSVQPGGLVAPGAITTGLTLSDGGPGPLFTLSQGGRSLSVSWPLGAALPVPSLSGSTATYAGVLPGVSLLVSATPTGVSDLIEVTSAAAAANPALARITFPVSAPGLTVSADAAGNLTAADSSGNVVFSAPPAQMWDSASPQPAAASPGALSPAGAGAVTGLPSGADGPVPGDHHAVIAVAAATSSVSLTPSAPVLSGPSVVYPVFIDPSWTGNKAAGNMSWSDVWKDGAGNVSGDWEYTNPAGGVRSGVYCSPDNNGNCVDPNPDSTWGIYRSYLNFTLPDAYLRSNPDYTDAQLQLPETWSWSCTASELDLWQTNQATQGLTWSNRPQQLALQGHATVAKGWEPPGGGSSSCPAGQVNLSPGPAISAAGDPSYNGNTITLELRATDADEAGWHVNSWKQFDASHINLVLYWRHKPAAPTGYGTVGPFNKATGQPYLSHCATDPAAPNYVNTLTTTWQATIDDPADRQYSGQSPEQLTGDFSWANYTDSTSGPDVTDTETEGATFTASHAGHDNKEYSWSVLGKTISIPTIGTDMSPVLSGPSSPPCYVTVDTDAPTGSVTITGPATPPIGQAAQYNFTDTTDPDVVGFHYGIGTVTSGWVQATGGSATVTLTPYTSQHVSLYAQAVDHAGNAGTQIGSLPIVPSLPNLNLGTLGYWPLNNASDLSGNGSPVTLTSGSSFGCGASPPPPAYSCSLNGEADTSAPVVSNEEAFSVSAWVLVSGCASYCVAMSEDGTNASEFKLAWQAACNGPGSGACWELQMRASDSGSAVLNTVQSAGGAAGTDGTAWAQLTAVFDSQAHTLRLYLNGHEVTGSPLTGISPWTTWPAGPLRLGAGFQGADPWQGWVSDACVFYGALPATDVQSLYDGGTGDGCAIEDQAHP